MFGKDTTKDSFVIHPVSSSFLSFGTQGWSSDSDLSFVPNSKAPSMAVNFPSAPEKEMAVFWSVVPWFM